MKNQDNKWVEDIRVQEARRSCDSALSEVYAGVKDPQKGLPKNLDLLLGKVVEDHLAINHLNQITDIVYHEDIAKSSFKKVL